MCRADCTCGRVTGLSVWLCARWCKQGLRIASTKVYSWGSGVYRREFERGTCLSSRSMIYADKRDETIERTVEQTLQRRRRREGEIL